MSHRSQQPPTAGKGKVDPPLELTGSMALPTLISDFWPLLEPPHVVICYGSPKTPLQVAITQKAGWRAATGTQTGYCSGWSHDLGGRCGPHQFTALLEGAQRNETC